MYNKFITLGIETSCDETSVSLYNNENGVLAEYIYNQKIHLAYGGTVPELASREHMKKLLSLIFFVCKKTNLDIKNINCIAYSCGPGLNGSLLIGTCLGKSLGFSLSVPTIAINHLEAHLLISLLFNNIKFPCLALLISGAHTMIIKLNNYNDISVIGETLDDSVGEVFDKIARALKLIPINGSSIENLSKKKFFFKNLKFPKSFYRSNYINLSFSGLKTHVLNFINHYEKTTDIKNIAYNLQNTIIKSLVEKCKNITKFYNVNGILLAGGVAANKELRLEFKNLGHVLKIDIYFPPVKYCMDNGTMIAFLGFLKLINNDFDISLKTIVYPRIYF